MKFIILHILNNKPVSVFYFSTNEAALTADYWLMYKKESEKWEKPLKNGKSSLYSAADVLYTADQWRRMTNGACVGSRSSGGLSTYSWTNIAHQVHIKEGKNK